MPKLKKEKKTKVKKPKIKKQKKPKEKKPKKPKGKKTKKEKKPMTKKKLILTILLLLVLAGAAAAGYYFMLNKQAPVEEVKREPPKYDYFSLDDDKIESITKTVGYRAIADAYGKNIVFEPWYEDAEEAKKAAKKAEKEKAEAEKAATESTEVEKVEETTTTYVYKDIETASEDVKKYVTHLMNNLGFKEVYPFYIDNPAGYIALSKDSATKGYTIQIDIDYTKDSYTVVLEKFKKPEEKKAGTAKATINRASAMDIIKKTPIEVLGLDESLDNLTLIGDPGHCTVDGMDCYGVHVYKTVNDNTATVILGTYYVAADKKTIYKYNVMDNTYSKINQ